MIDGIAFDSVAEARRWTQLQLLVRGGFIHNLERQITFPLIVNGIKICTYRADFVYDEFGERKVEDVKGFLTPEYKLKKKMMAACHGIAIIEIKN
jgi:hypothetical protein